ncbi:hypothetical protein LINGRAHAP2_LOCUS10575, partial [Linum grandiflorum]
RQWCILTCNSSCKKWKSISRCLEWDSKTPGFLLSHLAVVSMSCRVVLPPAWHPVASFVEGLMNIFGLV